MMKMTSDLQSIVAAKGSIELPASAKMTSDLISIAKACAASGATLRLTDAGKKMTSDLTSIARAGAGCVTFVFD